MGTTEIGKLRPYLCVRNLENENWTAQHQARFSKLYHHKNYELNKTCKFLKTRRPGNEIERWYKLAPHMICTNHITSKTDFCQAFPRSVSPVDAENQVGRMGNGNGARHTRMTFRGGQQFGERAISNGQHHRPQPNKINKTHNIINS